MMRGGSRDVKVSGREMHHQTYPLSLQVIFFSYATRFLALVSALVRSRRMVVGGVGLVEEEEDPLRSMLRRRCIATTGPRRTATRSGCRARGGGKA